VPRAVGHRCATKVIRDPSDGAAILTGKLEQ
jgi:hypothetical protein